MYKLFIQYRDGKVTNTNLSENDLRIILKKKSKKPIKWATVTTPGGTSKDVTKILFQKFKKSYIYRKQVISLAERWILNPTNVGSMTTMTTKKLLQYHC